MPIWKEQTTIKRDPAPVDADAAPRTGAAAGTGGELRDAPPRPAITRRASR